MNKLFDGRKKRKYPKICPVHSDRKEYFRYFYRSKSRFSNKHWIAYLMEKGVMAQAIHDFIYNGYPLCGDPLCNIILDKPR